MARLASGPKRPGATTQAGLRRLINAAMELERRAMHLYCKFESQFGRSEQLRAFWFDMAQHESRHFGALALVAGLLESAPKAGLRVATVLTPVRVRHLRRLLNRFHAEADKGVSTDRAFEIALELEGSEIEDVVLDLLEALKGEAERERALKLLIHDLGDLGYMIEKHTSNHELLARADALLERQVGRLHPQPSRSRPGRRRAKS
jgi:rubrerythrin